MKQILLVIETAESKVDDLIKKLQECFLDYREFLKKYESWLNLSNMSTKDIIKKGKKEFGVFDFRQLEAIQENLQQISYLLKNEFKKSHYDIFKEILNSLQKAKIYFKNQELTKVQCSQNIDCMYELVDSIVRRNHCKLYGTTSTTLPLCEKDLYFMEYECFINIKTMIYPTLSQIYHRLTVKLFPYINNVLNQNDVILEKNVFNKLQIKQYINISLDFVVKLLLIENKVKNNIDNNNLDLNQILAEISIIKNKLNTLVKEFFGFMIDVIEKKIFSMTADPNNKNQLDVTIKGVNTMIIKNLHGLNDLYLKIFELEKKIDNYNAPQQSLKKVDSQSDNCEKYILDLLTTEITAGNVESVVSSIENADKYIANPEETALQKILRIFTNIAKHKQKILAIILDEKELIFTVEELAEWEDINKLANEVPQGSSIEEDVATSPNPEEAIEEDMIAKEFCLTDEDKEAPKQQDIAELAESIQNINDISLESSKKSIVEDTLELIVEATTDPQNISENDDHLTRAVFFNIQGSFFVHSPYSYPNCEFKEQEYSRPTRYTNRLIVS